MTKNEDTSLLRTRGYVDSILPPIPPKRYFTIGEVSELCAVKPHVLRYWEQEFPQLRPMKRRGNRRYYQQHEVLLIRKIRELLYDEGFTIQGARMRLTGRQTMANLQAEASALARGAAVGGTFGLLPDDAPEAGPEETDQTPAEAERAGRALAAAGSANKAQPEHGTPDQRPEAALHPSGAQAEADQAVAERHAPGTVLAHKAKAPGSAAKQASKPSAEQATGLASEQATGFASKQATGLASEQATGLASEQATGSEAERAPNHHAREAAACFASLRILLGEAEELLSPV